MERKEIRDYLKNVVFEELDRAIQCKDDTIRFFLLRKVQRELEQGISESEKLVDEEKYKQVSDNVRLINRENGYDYLTMMTARLLGVTFLHAFDHIEKDWNKPGEEEKELTEELIEKKAKEAAEKAYQMTIRKYTSGEAINKERNELFNERVKTEFEYICQMVNDVIDMNKGELTAEVGITDAEENIKMLQQILSILESVDLEGRDPIMLEKILQARELGKACIIANDNEYYESRCKNSEE